MHQNELANRIWLRLSTEGGLSHRVADLNFGDLPPKSPEFCEMLPSLRSSPIFLFQAREEENSDSFHVVPSVSTKDTESPSVTDTYETFLRNLENNDNQDYGDSLLLSPECLHLTKQIVEEQNCESLSDDFQIYLQNEISPTPIENLYSTLPMQESVRTFEFPSFDENLRLENMEMRIEQQQGANTDNKPGSDAQQRKLFHEKELNAESSKLQQQRNSRKRKSSDRSSEKVRSKRDDERIVPKVGRPSHNDIERQRRNDMKARFDGLKAVIPDIERLERTPKIQILMKATEYIIDLHAEEKRLDIEKDLERKKNRFLLDKLVQLTQIS